ncbi:hypothetical protein ITP53_11270 [Nonomuraea sp. K274]|uniref:Uncharacterized protein n=1 Tax=Nonomuraea cypriaca TaxID=1187855 RepID=A0A931A959_9ACTN|nr:hypothetical protein [Nonomuraea cypriaca]MBF8186318.1 hypothetical protein [Nonomuraea cypriaca]
MIIQADFRREYQLGPHEIVDLPLWEFRVLLGGLSTQSLYRQVTANEPVELHGEAARSFLNTL